VTITIKIDTGNAAFQPPEGDKEQEVQRILEEWLRDGWGPRNLRDYNGNTVGTITVRGK